MQVPVNAFKQCIKYLDSLLYSELSRVKKEHAYPDITCRGVGGMACSPVILNKVKEISITPDDTGYHFRETLVEIVFFCDNKQPSGMKKVIDEKIRLSININMLRRSCESDRDDTIDRVSNAYEDCIGTIRHELIHAMQEIVLGIEGVTLLMENFNDSVSDDEYTNYLLSNVEYDPHVSDAIHALKRRIRSFNRYYELKGDEYVSVVKYYLTGNFSSYIISDTLMNSVAIDWFRPCEFIQALKQYDNRRWRRANRRIVKALKC